MRGSVRVACTAQEEDREKEEEAEEEEETKYCHGNEEINVRLEGTSWAPVREARWCTGDLSKNRSLWQLCRVSVPAYA